MSDEKPLSMKDREELLEMATNCKLMAIRLRTFHNKNPKAKRSCEAANHSVVLAKIAKALSFIEKAQDDYPK